MARVRSPNYPGLSLPSAIERIEQVHAQQQRTPEPREVVMRHMGYGSVNGRALKAISALLKYGFLEDAGKGLRVSDRAIAILFPDPANPQAKQQAISDAARAPDLFGRLFDRWEVRPSAEALKHFLIHQGFGLGAVDQVARSFYDTFDLVESQSVAYESSDSSQEEDVVVEAETVKTKIAATSGTAAGVGSARAVGVALNSTKPVFDFETVAINTKIDNQEDLAELIERLEQLKAMLPNKTQH